MAYKITYFEETEEFTGYITVDLVGKKWYVDDVSEPEFYDDSFHVHAKLIILDKDEVHEILVGLEYKDENERPRDYDFEHILLCLIAEKDLVIGPCFYIEEFFKYDKHCNLRYTFQTDNAYYSL